MKRKIITATQDGLERLRAVERVQKGETLRAVAADFKVHFTTIGEWVAMYDADGVERLNTYRKPRPHHEPMNPDELMQLIEQAPDYADRLKRLLMVAQGKSLKSVAAETGISVQSIMKDRRLYERGKLPLTIVI